MYKRIVALSDMHGQLVDVDQINQLNPDIVIVAGDSAPFSNHSNDFQMHWFENVFNPWLNGINTTVVGIGGNHDFALESNPDWAREAINWHYLDRYGVTIASLKLWGSAYVPNLPEWAFHASEHKLWDIYQAIPDDIDILITHGPAEGILDTTSYTHVGSAALAEWFKTREKLPKIHISGHIHEAYGKTEVYGTKFYNVSVLNRDYRPTNEPTLIELMKED